MRAAFPDTDVLTPDLPGTGSRLGEKSPSSMTDLAEAVRQDVRSRVVADHRLRLFGLSLGGMVAMAWAARHPDEIACLVVAASSAPDLSPLRKRFSWRGWLALGLDRWLRTPERRQAFLAWVALNRSDLRAEAARSWASIERERPVSKRTLRRHMAAVARWSSPAALHMPTLFLTGGKDRLVHASCSRRLARKYGAPLGVHPDAGHDITTDATAWVVDELQRFHDPK